MFLRARNYQMLSAWSDLPNTVLFYIQLICDHSICQPTIAIYYLSYPFDVNLHPLSWRPPAPEVIFHLFSTFFEPLMTLKNTCVQYGVISKHLPKHFKFLSFLQSDQNF